MAFDHDKSKPVQEQEPLPAEEEKKPAEASYWGLPNSTLVGMMGDDGDGDGIRNPSNAANAAIFREYAPLYHQIPSAEMEADRLSQGIRGTNPQEVRREMGERLGADLSGVRFHNDPNNQTRPNQLGARAWTSGKDVYFGKGGFNPAIAAHELVHTVQQGAVRGSVSQHAPAGSVQMWWWSKPKELSANEKTTADKVDDLLRLQAGMTYQEQEIEARKNEAYSKKYNQLKSDRDGRQAAQNAAAATRDATNPKVKAVLNNQQKTEYGNRIRSITEEEYIEINHRLDEEAIKIYDSYNKGLVNRKSKKQSKFDVKGTPAGVNYLLYKKMRDAIRAAIRDENPAKLEEYDNKLPQNNDDRQKKIDQGKAIIDAEDQINDSSGEASAKRSRGMADYMKNLSQGKAGPRKRNHLDVLAEIYRDSRYFHKDDQEGTNDKSKSPIDTTKNTGNTGNNKNIDIDKINKLISGGSGSEAMKGDENSIIKEEDDNSSIKGMREYDPNIDENLIKINTKIENDEDSNNDENLIEINTNQEKLGKKINEDPHEIGRAHSVTQELSNEFQDYKKDTKPFDEKKFKNWVDTFKNADSLANSSTELGMLEKADVFKDYVGPGISGAGGALSMVSGMTGVAMGAKGIKKNIENLEAGGNGWDVATSALDTASSSAAFFNGLLKTGDAISHIPGLGAINGLSKIGGGKVVPALGIATGGFSAVSGTIQGIRGARASTNISKQIEALEGKGKGKGKGKPEKELTKDQQKLLRTFKQGRSIVRRNSALGFWKAISGGITAGTGIASLFGPLAPAAAITLGAISLVSGIAKWIYDWKSKGNIRRDTIAEEHGFNWDVEIRHVRQLFPQEELSDKDCRAIILKAYGYEEGTRTAAYKKITEKRATHLYDMATDGTKSAEDREKAIKVIEALGVERKGGRFNKGAKNLLISKMML